MDVLAEIAAAISDIREFDLLATTPAPSSSHLDESKLICVRCGLFESSVQMQAQSSHDIVRPLSCNMLRLRVSNLQRTRRFMTRVSCSALLVYKLDVRVYDSTEQ